FIVAQGMPQERSKELIQMLTRIFMRSFSINEVYASSELVPLFFTGVVNFDFNYSLWLEIANEITRRPYTELNHRIANVLIEHWTQLLLNNTAITHPQRIQANNLIQQLMLHTIANQPRRPLPTFTGIWGSLFR
ncbi:MAG TPA: hypothetical protein PLV25_05295, partial [Opitutales bacterium]|nr:hypothetical protein [Opitutales bacterium]